LDLAGGAIDDHAHSPHPEQGQAQLSPIFRAAKTSSPPASLSTRFNRHSAGGDISPTGEEPIARGESLKLWSRKYVVDELRVGLAPESAPV
jgi:hypothetical protein